MSRALSTTPAPCCRHNAGYQIAQVQAVFAHCRIGNGATPVYTTDSVSYLLPVNVPKSVNNR